MDESSGPCQATRKIVVFVLPSFDGGGSQRVLLSLLRHLDRRRFRPCLVVFTSEGPLADEVPDDVECLVLGRARLRHAAPALFFALRRLRPDVVFSTMGYVNLALLLMRLALPKWARIVLREPNTPSVSIPTLSLGRIIAAGYRYLYPRADVIFCQSDIMASELRTMFGVPAGLLVHLPNPVDEERLRIAATPIHRTSGSGRRFVACGSLTYQKGFDRLIDLFQKMGDEDRLDILGEGAERDSLQARIDQADLTHRVVLQGFVDRPWPWFAGADALLISSRWEGQSNVALEALACGAPLIATPEAGGIAEVEALAPPGAAIVAALGEPFFAAMTAVLPRQVGLGPSLLPSAHGMSAVMQRFEEYLVE